MKEKEESNDNIFALIKEMQKLKLEKEKKSDIDDKNYWNNNSLNQDNLNRTSSFDYFRNSSVSISKLDDFDNYFQDAEEFEHKMYSKTDFKPQDFYVLSTIGKGAYAKVVLAKLKKTGVLYAIKIFEKHFLEKENKKYHIYVENDILNRLSHPNIINIFGSYEESYSIYLVLEYCSKGDLSDFVTKHCKIMI
jgi:hypothetical protein